MSNGGGGYNMGLTRMLRQGDALGRWVLRRTERLDGSDRSVVSKKRKGFAGG